MTALLMEGEELTSRKCEEMFSVSRPIATKDFRALMDLGIAVKKGEGRSTRYVLQERRNR
jgi:predicted HTH transcriptional regulator